jgi:hypothetical protein
VHRDDQGLDAPYPCRMVGDQQRHKSQSRPIPSLFGAISPMARTVDERQCHGTMLDARHWHALALGASNLALGASNPSADYANYRAHSTRPARSPAVTERAGNAGGRRVPRDTPSFAPRAGRLER